MAMTNELGTLNWWERLDWWAWKLLQRAKRRLFGPQKPESADVKYSPEILEPVTVEWDSSPGTSKVLEVPEPTVDVDYAGLTGAAIALRIDFQHIDDEIFNIPRTRIVFNVNPELVPEDGIVYVDFHDDYGSHDIDLADLLAAAIGWEMTTWTVLKIMGYDAAHSFDDFIMWKHNKKHWFLPIPEDV